MEIALLAVFTTVVGMTDVLAWQNSLDQVVKRMRPRLEL
jgi:hypothetical protein